MDYCLQVKDVVVCQRKLEHQIMEPVLEMDSGKWVVHTGLVHLLEATVLDMELLDQASGVQ